MGTGARGQYHGDWSKDGSMEMRVWDESMGTKTWGWELFPGILF